MEPEKPQDFPAVTGRYNAITDVSGVEVGNYDRNHTGTTVVLVRHGAVGGVDVRGSAPGSRETELLNPTNLVDRVDAVILTGGSAYGLSTADGVMTWLEQKNLGWPVGEGHVVPIVPAATLYDPGRFGREFSERPTAEYGRRACEAASSGLVAMGNIGAGAGAIAGALKGGIGTASLDLGHGVIVGAIVAVNSAGSTVNPETGELYAKYLEVNHEFGNLKPAFCAPGPVPGQSSEGSLHDGNGSIKNTTIGVVATNVRLSKAQARKIAEMAHDGMARAVRPAHTMFDGDTVFSLATGEVDPEEIKQQAAWGNMAANINKIGAAAADVFARAIVHAMLNARTVGDVLCYRDAYPGAFMK